MNATNDQIYIDRVLNGDINAYAVLVNKYKNMVFSLALNMIKNQEDAEEVAQDSFVKAYQKLESFRGEAKFSTWLYRIVYRNAISFLRKKKIITTDINGYVVDNHKSESHLGAIDNLKQEEQRKYVNFIISKLGKEDASIITLFYLNENTIEEIEAITGLSQSNIKVKLHRLRKKLYHELSLVLKQEAREIL